jgi:Fe-S-cluster-containing hydrogenase component 2
MIKRIVTNSERCVGCGLCEIVCSLKFEGVINPYRARIRVARVEERAIDLPVICLQCSDAPCSKACPTSAISKSKGGLLQISEEDCTSCGLCIDACPIGAISLGDKPLKPIVCNLCDMDPICIKYCPTKAIELKEVTVGEYEKNRLSHDDANGLRSDEKRILLAKKIGKPGKFLDPYDSDGYKSARKVIVQKY